MYEHINYPPKSDAPNRYAGIELTQEFWDEKWAMIGELVKADFQEAAYMACDLVRYMRIQDKAFTMNHASRQVLMGFVPMMEEKGLIPKKNGGSE